MWKELKLIGGIAACAVGVACSPSPISGKVTIVTRIDFRSEPFRGTFEVTEGSEVFGCSRGSFVDTPTSTAIHKAMRCQSGNRSGSFTAKFDPQEIPGPGDLNGSWSIAEGTEDFAGLTGGGDFWVVNDENGLSGVETLSGEVTFGP
jgi:hypothetical protein